MSEANDCTLHALVGPFRFSREWAMPNADTFSIPIIGQFVARHIQGLEITFMVSLTVIVCTFLITDLISRRVETVIETREKAEFFTMPKETIERKIEYSEGEWK
jgi:hypothetical protein